MKAVGYRHSLPIDDPQGLDIVKLKRKSVSVHWEFMFTRSLFHTADIDAQRRLLNAANLRRAHALLERGRAIGKTVLAGF